VQPLEDRTVPNADGTELIAQPVQAEPTDDGVIKEESPPVDESGTESGSGSIEIDPIEVIAEETPAPEEIVAELGEIADGEQIYTMMAGQAAGNDTATPKPNAPLPELGNRVWRDLDGNGFQDLGEPGIAFVNLELYEGDKLVGTTATNWLGEYSFNVWNVHNGTINPDDNGPKPNMAYQIRMAANQPALASLMPTLANQGHPFNDELRDSDVATAASGFVINFTTGVEERYTHLDAGFAPASSIGNLVWFDRNNNGRRDANEKGIGGITVRLLESDGATQVATTTTAADGSYLFTGLLPGEYIVEIAASNFASGGPLSGYSSSTGKPGQLGGPVEGSGLPDPNVNATDNDDNGKWINGAVQALPLTVAGSDEEVAVDFGFFQSASLTGRVFIDQNGNGQIDAAETTGLGKVQIRAAGPAGMFTTTTDDDGNYEFAGLPAGTYTITQAAHLPGFRSSTANLVTATLSSGANAPVHFGEQRLVDLKVSVSASRRVVGVGGTFVLTYRVKNLGTLDAAGILLSASLPAGVKYVGHETNGATFNAATQRATISSLAVGDEAVIKVRVRVMQAGVHRVRATVQSEGPEDIVANNQAGVAISTKPPPGRAPIRTSGWMFGSTYR
jgi:uncharacterized repeat protein (TIGR01451 family)